MGTRIELNHIHTTQSKPTSKVWHYSQGNLARKDVRGPLGPER
jgi:hypothetical protein